MTPNELLVWLDSGATPEAAACVRGMMDDIKEARDWVRKLSDGRTVTCVYCGHAYAPGTPTSGVPALTEHIKTCPHHPLRAAEDRIRELEAEVAGLKHKCRVTPVGKRKPRK